MAALALGAKFGERSRVRCEKRCSAGWRRVGCVEARITIVAAAFHDHSSPEHVCPGALSKLAGHILRYSGAQTSR